MPSPSPAASTLALALLALPAAAADQAPPQWDSRQLDPGFHAEGCCFADLDGDHRADLVAGPFIFSGPDFTRRIRYRAGEAIEPAAPKFSENFLSFTGDFNADGRPDILRIGFPGAAASWYENPGPQDLAGVPPLWKEHPALPAVDNESPLLADLEGDGRPELFCCHGGQLGYATFDPAKPEAAWVFHPISPKDGRFHRFTHGLGVGDLNGDGRADVLEAAGWWEQPAKADGPWTFHPVKFGAAPAQMLVTDVDGDGRADVACAWHSHEYGLSWHRQERGADGAVAFTRHDILPAKPDLGAAGLRISQMHALVAADVDGDGHPDLLTGKRLWAHGPKGDPEPDAPRLLVAFKWTAPKEAGAPPTFTPQVVHETCGIGTQFAVQDVDGDGAQEIAVANKTGIWILQGKRAAK